MKRWPFRVIQLVYGLGIGGGGDGILLALCKKWGEARKLLASAR